MPLPGGLLWVQHSLKSIEKIPEDRTLPWESCTGPSSSPRALQNDLPNQLLWISLTKQSETDFTRLPHGPDILYCVTVWHCKARLAFAREFQNWQVHLYRLGNSALTNIWYWDEILGLTVRPYSWAVGPAFLLVDNARPCVVVTVCRQFLENKGTDTNDWLPMLTWLKSSRTPLGHYVFNIQCHQVTP